MAWLPDIDSVDTVAIRGNHGPMKIGIPLISCQLAGVAALCCWRRRTTRSLSPKSVARSIDTSSKRVNSSCVTTAELLDLVSTSDTDMNPFVHPLEVPLKKLEDAADGLIPTPDTCSLPFYEGGKDARTPLHSRDGMCCLKWPCLALNICGLSTLRVRWI